MRVLKPIKARETEERIEKNRATSNLSSCMLNLYPELSEPNFEGTFILLVSSLQKKCLRILPSMVVRTGVSTTAGIAYCTRQRTDFGIQ